MSYNDRGRSGYDDKNRGRDDRGSKKDDRGSGRERSRSRDRYSSGGGGGGGGGSRGGSTSYPDSRSHGSNDRYSSNSNSGSGSGSASYGGSAQPQSGSYHGSGGGGGGGSYGGSGGGSSYGSGSQGGSSYQSSGDRGGGGGGGGSYAPRSDSRGDGRGDSRGGGDSRGDSRGGHSGGGDSRDSRGGNGDSRHDSRHDSRGGGGDSHYRNDSRGGHSGGHSGNDSRGGNGDSRGDNRGDSRGGNGDSRGGGGGDRGGDSRGGGGGGGGDSRSMGPGGGGAGRGGGDNSCFQFKQGTCTRGANCRFSHDGAGGGGGGGGGRGYQGGGGGRGDFGGRGGGFQGRGGRGGGNSGPQSVYKNMGKVPSILQLVQNSTDAVLMEVLNPPMEKRIREFDGYEAAMPQPEEWRKLLSPRVGGILNPETQIVRSNHFAVDTKNMPPDLSLYHVNVHRYERDKGDGKPCLLEQDMAADNKDSDDNVTTSIIITLRAAHPEWQTSPEGRLIGITYDGRAALYSSVKLDFDTIPSNSMLPTRGTAGKQFVSKSSTDRDNKTYGPKGGDSRKRDRVKMEEGEDEGVNEEKNTEPTEPVEEEVVVEMNGDDEVEIIEKEYYCQDVQVNGRGPIFRVTLTYAGIVILPATDPDTDAGAEKDWCGLSASSLRALDSASLAFVRWEKGDLNPQWLINGTKVFRSGTTSYQLAPAFVALQGYHASLKSCLAGLVLVCDMNVSAFLSGGEMIELMRVTGGFHSVDDMVNACKQPGGMPKSVLSKMSEVLKGAKVKTKHLGYWKKVKGFGESARDYLFDTSRGTDKPPCMVSIQSYFESKYKDFFKNGMKFPTLPTINFGMGSKEELMPAELVIVPGGQSRSKNANSPQIVAALIKQAAVQPHVRQTFITKGDSSGNPSIITAIRNDPTAQAFGIGGVSETAIVCHAAVLPQAVLQYGQGATLDPKLEGSWNTPRSGFSHPAKGNADGKVLYGVVVVGGGNRGQDMWGNAVSFFTNGLQNDARNAGLRLEQVGRTECVGSNNLSTRSDFSDFLKNFKSMDAQLTFVVMIEECYADVKLLSDTRGMLTQCLKWKNVEKCGGVRGYTGNVLLKVNTKLGGTNHTLASKDKSKVKMEDTFQDPPMSLPWQLDIPTMMMGVDVSHPDPGHQGDSMAAVVGSLDGRFSQFCGYISAQKRANKEATDVVECLEDATKGLLEMFMTRNNGQMPKQIIIYRDGVSDSQFTTVLETELPSIQGAIELLGYPADAVKIAIVVCQKRHNTRLVYEDNSAPTGTVYINPCPGLVVDHYGAGNSIASAERIEFYLNSHVAIQGTAKPTKYTLIYDEIKLTLSELELITYWSTYTYCRCNKSVSLATPAYYAHWAARRARALTSVGATRDDLQKISQKWSETGRDSTMFFI